MDRRLTTILAADLAGWSRLVASDEEGTIARLRTVRVEVVDPAVAEAGGRVFKTMGDGLLVEFGSTVAAVRAALRVQREMAAREDGEAEERRLRFRVGVHLGDVVIDGADVLGDAVNVAARLESLAPAGGICVSRAVMEQARGRVDATATALGPQRVKGLTEPVEAWRIEVAGVRAPAPKPTRQGASIVVLPFDDFSADPDQGFLADGIVEDVTTELSRFGGLFVIARNTAFAYRGAGRDVREIARELGVGYVAEGSVRRAGDRLRVTAQLIEAETGGHVWAERWDRRIADLFEVQDELAAAIVGALVPEMGAHERRLASLTRPEAMGAWELLMRGQAAYMRYDDAGFAEAETLFRRGLDLDPDYAPLHRWLALLRMQEVGTERARDRARALAEGLAAAKRALELDPRDDEALGAQAQLIALSGDPDGAVEVVERALRLNPNNAVLHLRRGLFELWRANPDAALVKATAERALKLSPRATYAWLAHMVMAWAVFIDDPEDEGREALRHALAACRHEQFEGLAPLCAAALLEHAGRTEEARAYVALAKEKHASISVNWARRVLTAPPGAPADAEANWARYGPWYEALVPLGLPRE